MECFSATPLNRNVIRLTMNEFQLISDSFGTGEHGNHLADLEQRLHVVVECFLFATPLSTADVEAVHEQLARQGMDERFKRNEEYFANLKRNVVADPDRFMNTVDPDKLGPSDRFYIKYEIDNATSSLVDMDEFVREYTYAFTDPPYGIRCSCDDEKRAICSQSMTRLFGDLSDFTIRKWSTDWSNYFDAGNEWWGAFLWTLVSDDGRGWWIGASTTD
ncbi:hypothetical protein [Lignipirellula cremea]|nr:hypothetical protein [Lignipirellula cremea]